ncbi:hypothetical protein SAMN05216323_11473 [Williamwhitmania taraxaci]|uniref:Uncharacterized protein n=1 Tax=Williamwhitmania taraxaci TaxID=1640674 RepID=A0A1G6U1F0_9BACT|nr:hypothetical protein SAMN05216323_11473 [Williamwhitmania taraxaci]
MQKQHVFLLSYITLKPLMIKQYLQFEARVKPKKDQIMLTSC